MIPNYGVLINSSKQPHWNYHHYKQGAISHAIANLKIDNDAKVINCKTGQITHILHPDRCSCNVCGNELEGKNHCPLCGALHFYSINADYK